METQKGHISMTLTAFAVTVISLGILVGSFMVSSTELQQLLTEAQNGQSPTPTPLINPEPADVEVKVDFRGIFGGTLQDGFNKFDYMIQTCDIGSNGFVTECGKNGNKETPRITIDRVLNDQVEISQTNTHTLTATKGGNQALVIYYGYYFANGKKDVSGVKVTHTGVAGGAAPCLPQYEKVNGMAAGGAGCAILINKDKVQSEITITLPDPTKKTFELSIGRERNNRRIPFGKCSLMVDTDGKNVVKTEGDCQAVYENDQMSVTYNYIPGTQDELNAYWKLNRCNGSVDDQNFERCSDNSRGEIDVVNYFEAEQLQALQPLQAYTCVFKPSEWPAGEAKADVQSKVTCSLKTVTPTPTAVPTTTTPTPGNTTPGVATPTVGPTVGPTQGPTQSPTQGPTPPPPVTKMFTSVALINSTTKSVTKVEMVACDENQKCQKLANTVNIPSGQRDSFQQEISKPAAGTTLNLGCTITLSDNSQKTCPETVVNFPQNAVFRVTVAETAITGKALSESQACDISGDQCCNAQDFTIIVNNYGLTSDTDEFISADINGDGIANTVDMLYVLENINLGQACQYNLSGRQQ